MSPVYLNPVDKNSLATPLSKLHSIRPVLKCNRSGLRKRIIVLAFCRYKYRPKSRSRTLARIRSGLSERVQMMPREYRDGTRHAAVRLSHCADYHACSILDDRTGRNITYGAGSATSHSPCTVTSYTFVHVLLAGHVFRVQDLTVAKVFS